MASNKNFKIDMVIDTDVFTYLFKRTKEALAFAKLVEQSRACISFVTVAEVYYGARKAHWGDNKVHDLSDELAKYVVLYPNYKLCLSYGDIKAQCILSGCPIADPDYWIAACAKHHKLPLLTNNWKHFKNIQGLKVLNPLH
jgi:tRNA(fMet)-specific endonuclease VapC